MAEFTKYNQPAAYESAAQAFLASRNKLEQGDADTIAARELKWLWARSQEMMRNNTMGVTAVNRLVGAWVGSGIIIKWKNEDGSEAKKTQKHFDQWAEDVSFDGYGNFYNLQATAARGLVGTGEGILRKYNVRGDNSKIPLAYQVLDSYRLDPEWYGDGEKNIRNSIEFSTRNRPTNYHLYKYHPHARRMAGENNVRVSVPASDVIHMFERVRPEQWRGVPYLSAVMMKILRLEDLCNSTMARQENAQAASWIIKKTNKLKAFAPGTVSQVTVSGEDTEEPQRKRKASVISGIAGSVLYLDEDEECQFASIQDIGPNLHVLIGDMKAQIAAALGLSYEQFSGDVSQANFSSIRAGIVESRIRVDMIQQYMFVNLFLCIIARQWLELATLYYKRQIPAGVYPVYVMPKLMGVDRLKDAQADALEIREGFGLLEKALEERGHTFAEMEAEKEKIAKMRRRGLQIGEQTPVQQSQNSQSSDSPDGNQDDTQPDTQTPEKPKTPKSPAKQRGM
jgi:lambda family phage portal protein